MFQGLILTIIFVEAESLTQLMIENNVGVTPFAMYEV
jgi:restriction endonuclease Mrr